MTRAQLKTAIQALGEGADTDTAQNALIEAAFLSLAGERNWGWLQTTSTAATMTIGVNALQNLPADIDQPLEVRIEFATDYLEPLKFMDYDDMSDRIHKYRENDVPQYWTYYNGQVLVWPRPNLAYTVTLDYVKLPPVPTDDSWVPPFRSEFHPILVWAAARMLGYRQRDWNRYQTASVEYRAMLQAMKTDDLRGSDSDTVGHWAGWQRVK